MKTTQKFQNISVKGFIEIMGEYTLPTVDGNFGDIMITDGVGNVTWQPPSALILSTDDVTEGSNLYYTNERVDDRVALLIQNGTGINWTYNDLANTLTGNVTLAPFNTGHLAEGVNLYFTNERVDDRVAVLIQNGTGISWVYNDGLGTLTPTISLSPFTTDNLAEGTTNKYLTNENIDDRVAALIQNGTGLTWTYNDPANILTGNVSLAPFSTTNLSEGSNLYYTNERVDDRVAALMTDTATVTWTYNDVLNTLEANAVGSPINIQKAGSLIGSRTTLNLIEGSGISLNVADNGAQNRIDITVTSTVSGATGTLYRILSNGSIIGDDDIEELNFSSKFSVVESPDKYVTVDINMLLEELADVAVLSPIADKDILQYNAGLGLWENVSLQELHSLNSLSDVTLSSPIQNGQALVYNSVSGEWENLDLSIPNLLDVNSSLAPLNRDILRYNGAEWDTSRTLDAIYSNGVQVGGLYHEILNFSSKFNVTEFDITRIDVDINMSIGELSDVLVMSGIQDGDILIYNSITGLFESGPGNTLFSLQDAYNISDAVTAEIITNATNGALTIKQGSGLDTDNVFEIKNGVSSVVYSITGEGKVTAGIWNGSTVDIAYGGTGQTTAQNAIDALTQVSGATVGHVLTKDGFGNATWQPIGAADLTIIKIGGVTASTGAPTLDFQTGFTIVESPTDEFNISIDNTAIDHDSLFNYVPDQHTDHTTVLMNAGIGLAGGGTIAASRTFDLDLNDLTTVTSITSADLIPFYDTVGMQTVNITQADFITGLGLVNGSGTAGYVSRWITGTQLGTGVIRDDGTTVTISESGSYVPNSTTGLRVDFDRPYSLYVNNSSTTGNPIGQVISNNGAATGTKTGLWIEVQNGTGAQYGLRITDGSQADGRFLKSNANGQANWADIVEADITDLQSYALSSVTLTAGIGLTGGGDLTTNRTFDLDIPGLPALTDAGVLASGDTFAVYNVSAAAHEEVTLTQLAAGIQSELSIVNGSGTTNTIAMFTGTNSIGDSIITYDGLGLIDIAGFLSISNTASNYMLFEATNNTIKFFKNLGVAEGTLSANGVTGIRTWDLPDASGTIALLSDIPATPALSAVLSVGNTSGANDIIINQPQSLIFEGGAFGSNNNNFITRGSGVLGAEDEFWMTGHKSVHLRIRNTTNDSQAWLDRFGSWRTEDETGLEEIALVPNGQRINFVSGATNSNIIASGMTGNRSWTLPDATGTIALTSDIPTVSGTIDVFPKFTGANSIGDSNLSEVFSDFLVWNTGGDTAIVAGDISGAYTLIRSTALNGGLLGYFNGTYQGLFEIGGTIPLTADRTWDLPDASGTIALLSDIPATPNLSTVLGIGNTTGANNIVVTTGQQIHFDTSAKNISESGINWNAQFDTIVSSNSRIKHTLTETVINDGGVDLDFRVEGNNISNLLNINGQFDTIQVNAALDATARFRVDTSGSVRRAIHGHTSGSNSLLESVYADSVATNGTGIAIYAYSSGNNIGTTGSNGKNYGAVGIATGANDVNIGVQGHTHSQQNLVDSDVGVLGFAGNSNSTISKAYGGYFKNSQTFASSKWGTYIELASDQASGTGYGLDINADSTFTSGTMYGARIDVGGTTPTKYGVHVNVDEASTINYGLYVNVISATTNWGLYVNSGNTYIGGELQLDGLATTPAAGYVLQSTDANGNADWVDVSTLIETKYTLATTNNISTELGSLAITNNSATGFKGTIIAIDNTTNATKFWKIEGLIKNIGGTCTMVGSPTEIVVAQDAAASNFDISITAEDITDSLRIEVTGHASNTVDWVAKIEVTEVIK